MKKLILIVYLLSIKKFINLIVKKMIIIIKN